jgi:hypothetical protein
VADEDSIFASVWKDLSGSHAILLSCDGLVWQNIQLSESVPMFDFLVVNQHRVWVGATKDGRFYYSLHIFDENSWKLSFAFPAGSTISCVQALPNKGFLATGFILDE